MYLYAPTDILHQRLMALLQQHQVPFSLHNQTFALKQTSDRDKLLDTLRSHLSQPEAEDLRVTFDLANLMSATSLTQISHRAETDWFAKGLVNDQFTHWFQPIIDARREILFAHECLIRLSKTGEPGRFYNGQEIIDAAVSRGDLHVFDSYSRRTAIRNAGKQHTTGRVFVNFPFIHLRSRLLHGFHAAGHGKHPPPAKRHRL